MTDHLTKERRSWNMSRIKAKDTKPEIAVRSLLHRMGFRFRLHDKKLPGKPDIVLRKYKTVIFVHGCFWHRHTGCKDATMPKSNREFWRKKFEANVNRFETVSKQLRKLGWRVEVIWQCEVKDKECLRRRLSAALSEGVQNSLSGNWDMHFFSP